jgi:hypothetical protein
MRAPRSVKVAKAGRLQRAIPETVTDDGIVNDDTSDGVLSRSPWKVERPSSERRAE